LTIQIEGATRTGDKGLETVPLAATRTVEVE
jgi:hypothetical protein